MQVLLGEQVAHKVVNGIARHEQQRQQRAHTCRQRSIFDGHTSQQTGEHQGQFGGEARVFVVVGLVCHQGGNTRQRDDHGQQPKVAYQHAHCAQERGNRESANTRSAAVWCTPLFALALGAHQKTYSKGHAKCKKCGLHVACFTSIVAFTIRTAVALYTVVQISNTFVAVLPQNILNRVLMAAIAGVAAVVVLEVAGRALNVVIPVQHKGLFMVKSGGFPSGLQMALAAVPGDFLV